MILKNKNAVVTGANRGIGKSILKVFAQNGAKYGPVKEILAKKFDKYKNQLEENFSLKLFLYILI